jgi:hypothetical protein
MTNPTEEEKDRKAKQSVRITTEVPAATIELQGDGNFRIHLQNIENAPRLVQTDNRRDGGSDGCYSTPNGPRC